MGLVSNTFGALRPSTTGRLTSMSSENGTQEATAQQMPTSEMSALACQTLVTKKVAILRGRFERCQVRGTCEQTDEGDDAHEDREEYERGRPDVAQHERHRRQPDGLALGVALGLALPDLDHRLDPPELALLLRLVVVIVVVVRVGGEQAAVPLGQVRQDGAGDDGDWEGPTAHVSSDGRNERAGPSRRRRTDRVEQHGETAGPGAGVLVDAALALPPLLLLHDLEHPRCAVEEERKLRVRRIRVVSAGLGGKRRAGGDERTHPGHERKDLDVADASDRPRKVKDSFVEVADDVLQLAGGDEGRRGGASSVIGSQAHTVPHAQESSGRTRAARRARARAQPRPSTSR